jgi:hypothetical protein
VIEQIEIQFRVITCKTISIFISTFHYLCSSSSFLFLPLPVYTMSTETKAAPTSAPELTSIYRVASIPLVSSSLNTIHSTLSSNAYTKSPYSAATGIAYSALGYTEPLQARLAPLTTRADEYANAGLDVVESRYPYPFKAKPEEITTYVRESKESAFNAANKTIDEKVKSPAYGVVQGIDQVHYALHAIPYPPAPR